MIYQSHELRIEAFAVKPVEIKTDYFDNVPNPHSTFWGIYGVAPLSFLHSGNMDFYYLGH